MIREKISLVVIFIAFFLHAFRKIRAADREMRQAEEKYLTAVQDLNHVLATMPANDREAA